MESYVILTVQWVKVTNDNCYFRPTEGLAYLVSIQPAPSSLAHIIHPVVSVCPNIHSQHIFYKKMENAASTAGSG